MAYYQPDRRRPEIGMQRIAVQRAKVALAEALQRERRSRELSQAEIARRMGSSQPRVATMEAGAPAVRIELLMRALLAVGVTMAEIGSVIAGSDM